MATPDDFIHKHRAHFDDNEPDEGHFDRFRAKMRHASKPGKQYFTLGLKVAAALLVVMLPLWFVMQNNAPEAVTADEFTREYRDAERFLEQNYRQKLLELHSLSCSVPGYRYEDLMRQMMELEKTGCQVNEELNLNNKDLIMNALLIEYQAKTEVVERLIQQINENC